MSRSGYSEDGDGDYIYLYRATVERAIAGKRGQAFLTELAKALDEMPVKRLIAHELITNTGEVCAIGAVCKARGLDVSKVDVTDSEMVGELVGISRSMAAEIEYENDERTAPSWHDRPEETPEKRWTRMRKWVDENLLELAKEKP